MWKLRGEGAIKNVKRNIFKGSAAHLKWTELFDSLLNVIDHREIIICTKVEKSPIVCQCSLKHLNKGRFVHCLALVFTMHTVKEPNHMHVFIKEVLVWLIIVYDLLSLGSFTKFIALNFNITSLLKTNLTMHYKIKYLYWFHFLSCCNQANKYLLVKKREQFHPNWRNQSRCTLSM